MKRTTTAIIALVGILLASSHLVRASQQEPSENTIVPGVRVGDYTFDISKDDVLKKLGEPENIHYGGEDFKLNNLPRRYYMFFGDISFLIGEDSVRAIFVGSPLYKFTNGLGVGDPEQKIKQAFGDDFQLREGKRADLLTYEDEGLTFEINKEDRTVMEIGINQPKRSHGDSDAPDSRKVIMLSEQSTGPITFPKIDRRPKPEMDEPREMNTLPKYDPDSTNPFQMDLRYRDLSKLDLSNSIDDLLYATFDDRTVWPAPNRMPSKFDWQTIMELGKNPGLGVRSLHKKGITGHGVSIAILDQPLLVDHQEYAERLRLYEEIHIQSETEPQMHGPAVASIAVGKTVGVAPEAELYYIAQWNFDWEKEHTPTLRYLAQGIHRILEVNKQLPKDKKIRVISISKGWTRSHKEYRLITETAQKARDAGMLVVCTSIELIHNGFDFGGLGRSPLADPEVFESYEPGLFLVRAFSSYPNDCIWVPMDSRTTASPNGINEYVFYRQGGFSWAVPYIAGVYALAAQVEPDITPERFWKLAMKTGRTIELEHKGERRSFGPIIDPVRLIGSIKAGEISNLDQKQSDNQQPDRSLSQNLSTIVRQAAAQGRILYKLTTPEEFKEIVGQPTREEVGNRPGTRVNLFYPGFSAYFFGWPDEPRTLGEVWCESRQIDIGQNRPVVLRDEGDLSKFGKYNDICGADLSRLDLSQKGDLLERMTFDSLTVWPKPGRLPRGFEPGRRIEEGKNPGLGVRSLHQEGINGSGVGIAIVDGILRRDHIEYADRIKSYHDREMEIEEDKDFSHHAAAVCSIAVGKTCGVAPGASLHYYAVPAAKWIESNRGFARTVEQIVGRNRNLPPSEKVRVISISIGVSQRDHYDQWRAAADKAKKNGILVVTCDRQDFMPYGTLKRKAGKDPDDPNNYGPSYLSGLSGDGNALVYVPIENRSMASHRGKDVYTFDTYGGNSWAAPYLAGLAALAFQVHPGISPDEIVELWKETATRTKLGPVVNPRGFIEAVKRL
jgi:subtilisin family serine protease